MLHGLGYKDAAGADELGECEETLNQARAELGLPLRDQYFGDELRMSRLFVSIRLRFRNDKALVGARAARARTQYLFFMVQSGQEQQSAQAGVGVFGCGRRR